MQDNYQQYVKGICLVTGTCIGAGMIGVPIKTGPAGLILTVITFIIIWGIMTASALLFLEGALSFKQPVNFISMTDSIFGKVGKFLAWIICILFMYSVMAAYAAGGSGIITTFCKDINPNLATVIFMLPFAVMIYFGNSWVSFFNRWLMCGVILSFILLCISIMFASTNQLQPIDQVLALGDFKYLFLALPSIVITFGYHEIIPPLTAYLEGKIKPLKTALILGSFIPLILYIIWQTIILHLIPRTGAGGLIEMLSKNQNPSSSLIEYIFKHGQNKLVSTSLSSFLFFALTCCLTSSAWALFDFLADGLKIKKNYQGKIILNIITFLPPIIYTVFFPNGFLKALSLAGGFSAIIMIIYPVLIVWMLRYRRENIVNSNLIKSVDVIEYRAPFNKIVMIVVGIVGLLVIMLEIFSHFNLF